MVRLAAPALIPAPCKESLMETLLWLAGYLCLLFAAYRLWRKECLRADAAEKRLAARDAAGFDDA